ncbi:MAG TPA: twin-arginine translocation signal domain-containing protein, partial [Thermoanaerobaculia bacterium]|nr:twin-arginine translocation signal domain-containing protein [Thermoanaerobaculia bacterium]
MITRRTFIRLSIGTAASALGTGLYTWKVEPHWLEIVRRPLKVAYLPSALEGKSLVQISDLHAG